MDVTAKAKLIGINFIRQVRIFSKKCPKCYIIHRYQESQDGVHNYNNRTLLTFKLCDLTLKNFERHCPPGNFLESILAHHRQTVDLQELRNAFIHYCAMLDIPYAYSCMICGYHPSIIVSDVDRKCNFRIAADSLPKVAESIENDEVDVKKFWGAIEDEILIRGFLHKGERNPIEVSPSFTFWAPWLGENTRNIQVLNTEYKKIKPDDSTDINEVGDLDEISDDVLCEMMASKSAKEIKQKCKSVGLSDQGSKIDCILRLKSKIGTRSECDKFFSKVWGKSGGWLKLLCPHQITYYIKNLLRAESTRDHVDALQSFRHQPSIAVNDMPHMIAGHARSRFGANKMFSPYDGRVAECTEENMDRAERGEALLTLPWLDRIDEYEITERDDIGDAHPITKALIDIVFMIGSTRAIRKREKKYSDEFRQFLD